MSGENWKFRPIEELIDERNRAKLLYDAFKPTSEKTRKTFLEKLAEDYSAVKGGSAAKKIEQLQKIEEQRRQARAVKHALGKTRGGCLTMIKEKTSEGIHEHFTET